MKTRRLGSFDVAEIGLGCMSLSHAYGVPPARDVAERVLLRAVDLGVSHFDTASLYGFGKNEELVGTVLKPHRARIHIASKCGMTGVNGVRVIDGRPETLMRTVDESLQRLQTDVIDLYYLHRFDKKVPIEDSVGAMAQMVKAGKVREIGLSEVSAATLKKAHAVHPVAAIQTEYSLWTRNPEVALIETCAALGVALVAFSPVARGFLADGVHDPARFAEKDIRCGMPRFQSPHFDKNLALLKAFRGLAREADCTPAQLALAWLLKQHDFIIPIPGTTSVEHLSEDVAASAINVSPAILARADALINARTVSGPRYPAATQLEIDTEEVPA